VHTDQESDTIQGIISLKVFLKFAKKEFKNMRIKSGMVLFSAKLQVVLRVVSDLLSLNVSQSHD
jgi:hypothetical protein